jgi:hypothetical protein
VFLLGSAITVGLLCLPNPRASDLPAPEVFSYAIWRASSTDSFNLFFPLPEESQDGRNYWPKHRGIDFKFDGKKTMLQVSLCFRTTQPNDASLQHFFGLMEIVESTDDEDDEQEGDEVSHVSSAEETKEDIANPVHIHVNDLIGNDEYFLKVRRVLNARTHVVVVVVESEHANCVVGSERILTIAQAQALYVAYNDL